MLNPVVYRVGILGLLFRTSPQLLEHHPIEPWGFWDNTTPLIGTPPHSGTTFWNTTPTFETPPHSGTTFWSTTPTFGTPPHRAAGTTFWNTTLSTQQREHQPARVGVLVQPLEHHTIEPRPREWDIDGRSLRSPQEIIRFAPLFDESRAVRDNRVCQLGQSGGGGGGGGVLDNFSMATPNPSSFWFYNHFFPQ